MIIQTYKSTSVEFFCDKDVELAEFSFAVEQSLNWLFSKGIYHFCITRHKASSQNVNCLTEGKTPAKDLRFSAVTSLETLCKHGYLPENLTKIWQINDEKELTIQTYHDLNPATTFGEIIYGFSDLITGFYWLGATFVECQVSLSMVQIMTDKAFSKKELDDYIKNPGPGYAVNQKVGGFSWGKS